MKGLKVLLILLLMFCPFFYSIGENFAPRLMIKIPTRQRPVQFFSMLDKYYQKLSGKYPYLFLISCDNDDLTMNNPEMINKLKSYPNLHYRFGNNRSKVEAYNANISEFSNNFDIVILTSDDMEPVTDNYDAIVVEKMLNHYPDFSGVLSFSDGYADDKLNTYPIMGIRYYSRFGYVYFPGYKSFYCDNELTEVSRFLAKETRCNIILFRHRFMCNGSDSLYEKNLKAWADDVALYEARRRRNFFVHQYRQLPILSLLDKKLRRKAVK